MTKKQIYLDNAATTPVDPEVLKAMLPYFSENYGNPESLHSLGLEAKEAVDKARATIAKYLNCQPSEIVFTGSGTESNNLAIIGTAKTALKKSSASKNKQTLTRFPHLITSKIEHPSVLNTFKSLEKEGFCVTYLNVDKEGFINLDELKKSITSATILVSIMFANNEIGTIENIEEIGKICKEKSKDKPNKIIFHTDACQAAEFIKLDAQKLNIDLMTINASKIYGPKGAGFLYIKRGTKLESILKGGEQEFGIRPSTHNVPGIAGIAKAFELAQKNCEYESKKLAELRNYFIDQLFKKAENSFSNKPQKNKLPQIILNGPDILKNASAARLPNNINISFPGLEGKELLLLLDSYGICVSTGSACNLGKNGASHVLTAIGLNEEIANSSIRLSLGKYTTKEDLDYTLEILEKIINKLKP